MHLRAFIPRTGRSRDHREGDQKSTGGARSGDGAPSGERFRQTVVLPAGDAGGERPLGDVDPFLEDALLELLHLAVLLLHDGLQLSEMLHLMPHLLNLNQK